jgi:membrane protein implicated in regulation of membrane protease activity
MWLIIILFLGFVEAITVNLVTIWFVISGIVSLILSFFIDDFIIQFSVFVILGILLLITTRSWLNKVFKINNYKTNLDRVIGMQGIVTEKITKNSPGEVKVDGKRWMAISDKTINVDNDVKILEIDGVKLKVEKWED